MATDFFERQADARKSTTWLITMFSLAVLAIVVTIFCVMSAGVLYNKSYPLAYAQENPAALGLPLAVSAIALVVILCGTLYKVLELRRGGGTLVAERLGGRRIYPNSNDPVERRLLNIVEEMALASGTPVPPVFLMNEQAINAFAAGYSQSDAVLGVTDGCATKLTRDELQGVIAHEFSHILNGDMRMSIRLIGILHGILLIGLTGQLLFRMLYYSGTGRSRSRSSRDNNGQAMMAFFLLAILLVALGFLGTFLGNLIKAAVSRQREFLADASAIQFTRNPQGLAGALKKIGGYARGSKLSTAAAAEASHMFFAKGVFEGFSGLWATHPNLDKRIRAIEPNWDGTFPEVNDVVSRPQNSAGVSNFVGDMDALTDDTEVPVNVVDHAVDQVGEPTRAHQHYAVELISEIPTFVVDTVREPYGSRAVLYALLFDQQDPTIRSEQLRTLEEFATPDIVLLTKKLLPTVDTLDVRARLPLVDMAVPALRAMCKAQYDEFSKCFMKLVAADNRMDLFEWMLSQVLMRHLRPQFEKIPSPRIDYYALQQLGDPISTLLSAVAFAGNSESEASDAFAAAAGHLPEVNQIKMQARKQAGLAHLDKALRTLRKVSVRHRGRLVDACAAAISADEQVRWQEAELLRGISDLLDCPMPPLLIPEKAPKQESRASVSA